VIIVKEAQNIKKWEALGLYMDNPQPTTILVFCYKHGSPDKRLNIFKTFESKGGVMMVSDPLKDYQVEKWIREYLSQRNAELKAQGENLQIDPRVSKILADSLGTELSKIVGALQKLIDGRPTGTTIIDANLIERNIGISKDYNIFELQNALIENNVFKANQITQYFANSKDHPLIKEIIPLYNFFANLMVYHYLPDKSDRVAGPALGVAPYFVKDYAAAARRFSAGKTFVIIGYLRDIDARLRGINNPSAKDADLWKELIYKILH
jgi:DNA polymerase-3 subunit delta